MKPGNPRARLLDWTGQTLFGKWTVERLIGVGGTSAVLQARHRNGRRAALKILHPHLAAHGRMRERFLREGRLANLVNHPGVVAVLDDFITDDGTAVLVLELVEGQTLATLAKESGGTLEPGEVVTAACAVLQILAVAHDANVIHRDIKPENILRCVTGTYKLADFGLAALCHELGMLTGTNASLGTPAYMSPEQARGDTRHIDPRTDIFGLGATMLTLLTGSFLHGTAAQKNLVVAAATEPAPPVLSIDPNVHPPLAELIDRAVRMNREERWPNVRAMLAELEVLELPSYSGQRPRSAAAGRDDAGVVTASSSLMSWTHARTWLRRSEYRSRRRRVGMVVGGAAAVAAIAFLSLRVARAPSTSTDTASGTPPVETIRLQNVAVVPAPPDGVPATKTAIIATAGEREIRPAPKHSTGTRTHVLPKTRAKPAPSSAPRAPSAPNEPNLAVPDEVLDRRE